MQVYKIIPLPVKCQKVIEKRESCIAGSGRLRVVNNINVLSVYRRALLTYDVYDVSLTGGLNCKGVNDPFCTSISRVGRDFCCVWGDYEDVPPGLSS